MIPIAFGRQKTNQSKKQTNASQKRVQTGQRVRMNTKTTERSQRTEQNRKKTSQSQTSQTKQHQQTRQSRPSSGQQKRTSTGENRRTANHAGQSDGWVISPPVQEEVRQKKQSKPASRVQSAPNQRRSSSKRRKKKGMTPASKLMLLIILLIIMLVVLVEGISAYRRSNSEENQLNYSSTFSSVTAPVAEKSAYPTGTDPETLGSLTQLVNQNHGVPTDYEPTDLVMNDLPGIRDTYLRKEAAEALANLFAAAEKDGAALLCCSGFRSYASQQEVYADQISQSGEEEAKKTTAPPGFSEHQTGLCMDVTSASVNNDLTTDFINTTEGKWLDKNAWKYGYIVRYPDGMEKITGYTYEPWHIRYLGKDVAKAVYLSGKTYEEYLGILD